jgi:hypothetical protein
MLNLNTDDINSIGNIIGTLIFFIIIFIGIFIIIDEIFNISKFCFKYTYLFNYGKINENVCKNNIIEFETARYRIHNELNKYKLEKDIFNKNWINYVVFVSILLISLLMCIAFGYIFKHLFINNNFECEFLENDLNLSFFNKILKCLGYESRVPNCSFNYFIFYTIIIFYPITFLLKFLVNIDYTIFTKIFYIKLFHLFISICLLYFIYLLINISKEKFSYNNITLYISFIIVFYIVNISYDNSYNEYYNINKGTNIYSKDKSIISFLNKYFHFANNIDENDRFKDIVFFEIYKQQEPKKPKAYEKPKDLENFKYCSEDDFNDQKNKYCYSFNSITKREEYNKIKNDVRDYYQKKAQFEKNMNTYNIKYNIYKNNKIEFPEFVPIFNYMLPKLLGFDKYTHILLFVSLIIFIIYYNYLKTSNNKKEADFIYNTIIIYIISLLSILILSNSVLVYNTYVNKYLIYEPIAYYKEDLFNIDVLFNALLNKDTNKTISNSYINIYNKISSKKLSSFGTGSAVDAVSIDEHIKKINKNYHTIVINGHDNLKKYYLSIIKILFSDLLKINSLFDVNFITEKIIELKANYFDVATSTSASKTNLITFNAAATAAATDAKNLRTFFIIIKNIFVGDKGKFDIHIQKIKNNLKYLFYKNKIDIHPNTITEIDLYKTYLINDISNEEIGTIDNTINNEYTKFYQYNLKYIDMIFDYYKDFLIEFRTLIIELFNSTEVVCEDKENVININNKLNNYLSKMFTGSKDFNNEKNILDHGFSFKLSSTESKIEIYKRNLKLKIDSFNNLFSKYYNIIKVIYIKGFENPDETGNTNNLEYNIISNYNYFNKDTTKHIDKHLLKFLININNENKNKYDNYDSERLLKLNLSMNNISWSFVILMIIIAIFLIEPIIIQS